MIGVDLAPAMVAEAERKRRGSRPRRSRSATRRRCRSPTASFDLVVLVNMIPFFDELARVTAPGGTVVISFSRGAETPIFVSDGRLQRELGRRGFADFAAFAAPPATAFRARRG